MNPIPGDILKLKVPQQPSRLVIVTRREGNSLNVQLEDGSEQLWPDIRQMVASGWLTHYGLEN